MHTQCTCSKQHGIIRYFHHFRSLQHAYRVRMAQVTCNNHKIFLFFPPYGVRTRYAYPTQCGAITYYVDFPSMQKNHISLCISASTCVRTKYACSKQHGIFTYCYYFPSLQHAYWVRMADVICKNHKISPFFPPSGVRTQYASPK